MRRYAAGDEERIRASALVREWMRSGLLDATQAAAIDAGLRTDLRRTTHSLRAVLFLFGTIVACAAVGFVLALFDMSGERALAQTALAAGLVCFLTAELLVFQFRLYRFGVEEALAVWSVVFVAGGVGLLLSIGAGRDQLPILAALLVGAIASLAVYLRFGYLYAAVAAAACAALTPWYLEQSEMTARIMSASILALILIAAGSLERAYGDDVRGDDYGSIHAAAWLGLYAVLNLRLTFEIGGRPQVPTAFYWGTYAATWLLPAIAFHRGLRERHRGLLDASLIMAVATLLTSKSYLGWERHTWDPIVLGVFLTSGTIAVRRWLSLGTDGQRHGFTPLRLLSSDRRSLAALSAAAAFQPHSGHAPAATQHPPFEPGGGQSGGAGGGAGF